MIPAAAVLTATPALASNPVLAQDPASVYVTARAASISGNHAEAAQLLARLASAVNNGDLAQKAVREAISAGDIPLALKLAQSSPEAAQSVDARLLLVADALRRNQFEAAEQLLNGKNDINLGFWSPLVRAWSAAERKDRLTALTTLAHVPKSNPLAAFVDEETALILIKLGRTAEAEPYARRAIAKADSREYRVRLSLAGGFQGAGDHERALAMIDGIDANPATVRAELEHGQLKSMRVDTAAKAFSEQLLALALEMRQSQNGPGNPVNIVQIARYAAPGNSAAAILLGAILDDGGRLDQALAAFRSVSPDNPLYEQAVDAQARALADAKRYPEALALAQRAASARNANVEDFARLGDVLSEMERYDQAAHAYDAAIQRVASGDKDRLWPLLLLQANALESANRWPEARQVLSTALAMAPDQPLILNFLGYAKLERGEDLETAEALIRKANELAPNDASITDSLGWALYKRGRIDEAITVLQKAAMRDPVQAEIQEHLGDALYTAGRRFEARFAWRAALATAEDEDQKRISKKIESGLTQATAAR